MRMRIFFVSIMTFCFLLIFACQNTKIITLAPEELERWTIAGIGSVKVDKKNNQVLINEGVNSKGITIISPSSFGKKVIVRFKVKALSPNGVNIVFLSISSQNGEDKIAIPENYQGDFSFWTQGQVQNYMFSFHTGFHQPNSWIKRNPGEQTLCEKKDVVSEEIWYEIEVGRYGKKLWMKVDKQLVCEAEDEQDLPGGQIALRLRGPGDGSYSCLFKDLEIIKEK